MRKLTIILALCLLSSWCFGAATLIQSNAGGNVSTTFTAGGTLTTSAVGFTTKNSTLGSTLIMCYWLREDAIGGTAHGFGLNTLTITTPGFSWTNTASLGTGTFEDFATNTHIGGEGFAYISNAAVMSTSVTTTISGTVPSNDHVNAELEFSLYEVGGLSTFNSLDGTNFQDSGAASNPVANITFSGTKFVLTNMVGYPGSNLTAASGWTLGPNATAALIGNSVYDLALTTGSSTEFVGNLTLWATHGIVFNIASAAISIPRHKGFIN